MSFTDQVIKDVAADSKCYIMAVYTRLQNCCTSPSSTTPQQFQDTGSPMLPTHIIPPEPMQTLTPPRSFLTLDIETLGLMHHKPLPPITCICLFDGTTRYEYLLYGVTPDVYDTNKKAILQLLDDAERLAGYNAILFDLPYIAMEMGVDDDRLAAWR
jgi:uncharacterized protein YprB with RNaseH-like and TPR domain